MEILQELLPQQVLSSMHLYLFAALAVLATAFAACTTTDFFFSFLGLNPCAQFLFLFIIADTTAAASASDGFFAALFAAILARVSADLFSISACFSSQYFFSSFNHVSSSSFFRCLYAAFSFSRSRNSSS